GVRIIGRRGDCPRADIIFGPDNADLRAQFSRSAACTRRRLPASMSVYEVQRIFGRWIRGSYVHNLPDTKGRALPTVTARSRPRSSSLRGLRSRPDPQPPHT